MLASITPLGERGRHSHWMLTTAAFAIGAVGAGAAVGTVLGELGALTLSLSLHARMMSLAAITALGLALDLSPLPVPGPNRQVNERWLDRYRGWVYGLGFGVQLGAGVTTVVSSAATYVALGAALLSQSAGAGGLIVGCYGAVRGLQPLAAAGVDTPAKLVALHARIERARRFVPAGVVVALLVIVALAVTWF